MTTPEYTPGDWYAVVAGGTVLLLAPSTPPDVVRDVWACAPERGGGLGAQLDALVRRGIGELHAFAAVDLTTGTVQAALRGEVEVEVVRGTRTEVLAAPEVVSWSERAVGPADEVTIRVSGGSRETALPIVSGVVRAARVRVRLADTAQEVSAPEPAPEVSHAAPEHTEVAVLEPTPEVSPDAVPFRASAPLAAPLIAPVEPDPIPAPVAPAPRQAVPKRATAFTPPAPPTQPVSQAPPASPAPVLPGPASADDHDGLTILSGELASIRRHLPSWAMSQPGGSSGAVVPSPALASGPIPIGAVAPPLLVLSTGARVPVDGVVLIGRAPQATRAPGGGEPRLVAVPSPEQDISRTHAEVRLESGRVLVTDLYSTNGITVTGDGRPTRRIAAGEPVTVGEGEIVDLGDGVTFTVESGA